MQNITTIEPSVISPPTPHVTYTPISNYQEKKAFEFINNKSPLDLLARVNTKNQIRHTMYEDIFIIILI